MKVYDIIESLYKEKKSGNIAERTNMQYDALLGYWIKAIDCYVGEVAIKSKGETYLPKLDKEKDKNYNVRLSGAKWASILSNTVDSVAGLVSRKPTRVVEK